MIIVYALAVLVWIYIAVRLVAKAIYRTIDERKKSNGQVEGSKSLKE